ncbi:MAG TPA: hypothetical protein VD902_00430 [Symbiobacteriaceae bacterium]|nr:hypothetical protein [Symbiobacteriaceae bacterium]
MESPIRDQIRLDGRWQTRPLGTRAVSVFVPGSWAEKKVVLKPAATRSWSAAEAGSAQLDYDAREQGWQAGPHLNVGEWNAVSTDGDTSGGRLVASNPLHITALEARVANQRSVSVRIRINGEEDAGLLGIVLTLSSATGAHIGGTEITVTGKTRDLTVEVPVKGVRPGVCRLKATLSTSDRVVDNARIDLQL